MPFYSILLIGSWVIVAGVIAYTGNWVGRRLGKQRLTIFGLRPRYTATIFTILAGMLIAGLTLFAVSRLSVKVQIALTRVDALIKDQITLQKENAVLRTERVDLQSSLARVKELRKKSDADLKTAQAATRDAQVRSNQLSVEIGAKTVQLKSATRQLASTQTELAHSRADLTRSRADLARVHADLSKATVQLNRATAQAFQVGRENLELYTRNLLFETREVIYRRNDEVNRGVIRARHPARQIQAELMQLMAAGSSMARKRGAATGTAGPALRIPSQMIGNKSYNQDQILGEIAKRVAESKSDVVVRVMALFNCVQGQQVMVDFDLKPNKIIYRQGDEIASCVLDSNKSEAELLGRLIGTLQMQVRADALQRGLIPKTDGGTYESIGEVSYEELLPTVQRVKKQGGLTRVRFQAEQDTWAEGPLNIKFQVVQERSASAR